jgi:carboxypeptidase PM20D1
MPARLEFVRPTIRALLPYLPWPLRMVFGNLWLTGGLVKMGLAQSPFSNAMIRNTIAPTIVQGGYKLNILPEKAAVFLNCRLLPGNAVGELLAHIRQVVDDEHVTIRLIDTSAPSKKPGSLDTPNYRGLEAAIARLYPGVPVCPIVMTGSTDARHYEGICRNVYRFQPVVFERPDDDRTHGIDERLPIAQLPVMVEFNTQVMQAWAE